MSHCIMVWAVVTAVGNSLVICMNPGQTFRWQTIYMPFSMLKWSFGTKLNCFRILYYILYSEVTKCMVTNQRCDLCYGYISSTGPCITLYYIGSKQVKLHTKRISIRVWCKLYDRKYYPSALTNVCFTSNMFYWKMYCDLLFYLIDFR